MSPAVLLWAIAATAAPRAETRSIDVERSTLTVFVYKSGLFSAFADDHVIRAPIAGGVISTNAPLRVEVAVRAATLTVLDPGLAAGRRADVQVRMLGPDVLDSATYPDIAFASTAIEPVGANRWTVTGRLTIHGVTRSTTFPVAQSDGRYRGTALLKQRHFGIEPIYRATPLDWAISGGRTEIAGDLRNQRAPTT